MEQEIKRYTNKVGLTTFELIEIPGVRKYGNPIIVNNDKIYRIRLIDSNGYKIEYQPEMYDASLLIGFILHNKVLSTAYKEYLENHLDILAIFDKARTKKLEEYNKSIKK